LILFLEGNNLARRNSYGDRTLWQRTAERWLQVTAGGMYGLRICDSKAGSGCLHEDIAQWRTEPRIGRRYRRQHILVKEANSPTYRGFAPAGWIPGKAQLWRKIEIGLPVLTEIGKYEQAIEEMEEAHSWCAFRKTSNNPVESSGYRMWEWRRQKRT
jgi:hypothetical protein